MLEYILYCLGQLFLIGVYSFLVLIVFGIVIIILLAIVKVILETIYGRDNE